MSGRWDTGEGGRMRFLSFTLQQVSVGSKWLSDSHVKVLLGKRRVLWSKS